jgi:AcrR family transcriptional regulator
VRPRSPITREITTSARRQLAEVGAAALSLRAVSRELGMASSALYRYFPSRDDLLTALIVDAYDAVGAAAEEAVAAATGTTERWLAVATAIRTWATSNTHEYALIYGSPVPGYQAPQGTIPPAERVSRVMLQLVQDGFEAGEITTGAGDAPRTPAAVQADFARIAELVGIELPDDVTGRALLIWTNLFGTLSFELFGHLKNAVLDYDTFFEHQMRLAAGFLRNG